MEIDLVLEMGQTRWAIDELTTAPAPADLERFVARPILIGATRRCLVSRTARPAVTGNVSSSDIAGLLRILERA